MKSIMFITVLVFVKNIFEAHEHKNASVNQRNVECTPKIKLQRCNRNFENTTQWVWRRDKQYLIQSVTKKGCESSSLSYTWTIKNENGKVETQNKLTNKSVFILDYYVLDTGLYTLTLTVTETFQKKKLTINDKCLINIRAENPIPVILGGNVRIVPSQVSFIVDGKYSVNLDIKPELVATLNYKWSCVCHTDPKNKFCKPSVISYGNEVEFPSAPNGERFTVYLSVSTDYSPWFKTKQDINVIDGGYNIIIDCLKNCLMVINYRSQIYLEAFCENCPEKAFTWIMKPREKNVKKEIDFKTETTYGNNNPKLVIKKDVLVPGDEYQFYCYYKDNKSYAYETIKVNKLPQISGECDIRPESGLSFVTLFTIICNGVSHTQPVTFNLYQISDTDMLLATNDTGRFDIHLSTETKILCIKISDPDNLYIVKNLPVQVKSFISQVPEQNKMQVLMEKYDDIIPYALKTENTELIIQIMNMVSTEAKFITSDDKLKKDLKQKILEDLQKLPLQTQNDITQATSLNRNLWNIQTEHDRFFTKASVDFSQKIAKKQLKIINKAPFPDRLNLDVTNTVSDLLWVANQSLESFSSETIIQDITFMVTTPTDMLTFPVVTEYYVDYKDADLDYASRIRDYKHTTKVAMDVFTLAGLATARTLIPGEPIFNVTNKPNVLQVLTDSPNAQISTKLGISDARVIGSQSLTDTSDYLHGVITVYPDNPYWWHKNDINISTKVLNANYFHKDKLIVNIKKPLQLLFTGNWVDPIHTKNIITMPIKTNITELEKYIAVHRVDVKQGGALIVNFYNIENSLDIVITYNRKPRVADFNLSYISITKENSTHIILFRKDLIDFGNCWFYIGVLPSKISLQEQSKANLTISYEISFVTTICSYWSNSFEKWISSDCRTGKMSNNTHINCFCTHHSSYAGSYLNAPNLLDSYKEINFTLKLCTSWMIFILVSVAFLIYCLLLLFIGSEPLHNFQKPLFLTDNIESDNYYYLIVVKTSSQSFSGTTSNIGLQIFGSIANSRLHLINFPDPYKKLLQKSNKDQFVLATFKNLGNLNYIWLWFDCVGTRPSWRCEWITIIDLQNKDKWYFEVGVLFSVLDEGYCKIVVKPSVKKELKTWSTIFDKHNWNITTLRKGRLSYVKRLTIILSTILTTYSVTLALYGIPRFRRSDALGYGHYQIFTMVAFTSFLSSLMSFFINLFFVRKFSGNLDDEQYKQTWSILVFLVIINLTFLVVFGFWVSYVNSLLWLTSTFGALALIIVFFETIYSILTKNYDTDDVFVDAQEILIQTKRQKDILTEHFGKELLRPLFINKYRSLTVEEWKTKKEKELLRRRVGILVQDLIMFGVYIILLFFIVLGNRDTFNVFSNKKITELLVTEKFEEISSFVDVYEYLNNTLIKVMHSINWYGVWNILEPGLLSDFSSKILGVGRIRQQRVCKKCFTIPKIFQNFTFKCIPEYSLSTNVKDEFMEFWKPIKFVAVPRLASAWKYTYDAMSTFGYFQLYSSGGYSAPLGRTTYNSYYNLQYYFDTNWIDSSSRVLFVEFLSYNVDYNMFHVVTLIIEKSATGLIYTTHNIISTRLLFIKHELASIIGTEIIVFVLIVAIMLFKNIYFAKTKWRDYLKDRWNFVDIFIVTISFLSMGIYWYRFRWIKKFLNDLETAKHNNFLDYFNLIRVEYLLTIMAALLICVATVRLWKLLRFIPDFKVFEQTIFRSRKPLLGLAICHWLIWSMYTILGATLFGPQLHYFHNAHSTLTTLMLLSMNLYSVFNFNALIHVGGVYAYLYFASYALVMLTIYSFYVSLLMIFYTECNRELSNSKEYYSLRKYITDELRYYKESFCRNIFRLSAGEDVKIVQQKVTPKNDQHRYANSITLSPEQLLAMLIISKSTIDNLSTVRDKNVTQTIATFIYYLSKSKAKSEYKNNLIGYMIPDNNDIYKIMFDQKLLDMEYIVRKILEQGVQENSKLKNFEQESEVEVYCEPLQLIEHSNINQLDHVLHALTIISDVIDNIRASCDRPCKRCKENLIC